MRPLGPARGQPRLGRQLGRRKGLSAAGHWFEELADFVGPAYLRYSFTKGTEQEAGVLVDVLDLLPGERVVDVGCGPGRHVGALSARGLDVVGVDISARFVALGAAAVPGASFARADARRLPLADGSVDAAVSLCQGGFGLLEGEDAAVVHEIARVLRPGGRAALTAFSSYFLVRNLESSDRFDPATGVNVEDTVVRDEDGDERTFELRTTCFTPRELAMLVARAGLRVRHVGSVTPGDYGVRPPDLDRPELFVVAEKAR